MADEALAQQAAGLRLTHLWRSIDSPGRAFLVMEVQDIAAARTYLTTLFFTWAKQRATVHQYEFTFIEEVALPML